MLVFKLIHSFTVCAYTCMYTHVHHLCITIYSVAPYQGLKALGHDIRPDCY